MYNESHDWAWGLMRLVFSLFLIGFLLLSASWCMHANGDLLPDRPTKRRRIDLVAASYERRHNIFRLSHRCPELGSDRWPAIFKRLCLSDLISCSLVNHQFRAILTHNQSLFETKNDILFFLASLAPVIILSHEPLLRLVLQDDPSQKIVERLQSKASDKVKTIIANSWSL